MRIDLIGKKATHLLTQETGIITGVSESMFDIEQVLLQKENDKDGKSEAIWTDLVRVRIEDGPITQLPGVEVSIVNTPILVEKTVKDKVSDFGGKVIQQTVFISGDSQVEVQPSIDPAKPQQFWKPVWFGSKRVDVVAE